MIVRVTETLHYARDYGSYSTHRRITPGLVDRDYLKKEIGDEMYVRARALGVVIEDPS